MTHRVGVSWPLRATVTPTRNAISADVSGACGSPLGKLRASVNRGPFLNVTVTRAGNFAG